MKNFAPHWPLHRPGAPGPEPAEPAPPKLCAACGATADKAAHLGVCDACGHHERRSARQTIAHLTDAGSFQETDGRLVSRDPLGFVDDRPYHERLVELRERTGESDAIITGMARIDGHEIVLAVLDFGFLGGSMGVVVGEKIARAAHRAARKKRPLVTVVASGGARMQEGMLSLLQMAKTAAAIKRLKDQGAPYVSVLTNPTTGGVFASFANLGDLVIAEPGALIGFAGPRVAEQAMGRKLPPGAHTAEFLLAHGMVDAIVDRRELPARLATALSVLAAPRGDFPRISPPSQPAKPNAPVDPWLIVQAARDPDRPTSLDYIQRMLDPFVELHGDRAGSDDPAVIAGIGLLGDRALAVVALERGHGPTAEQRRGGRARPAGYRKAQRVMRLGARLGMPVLSLIDTPGAYPGVESEEGGLASELAESMALMSDLPTPTVAAVIGEGGSGGALALAVADRVLMQQFAVYSVIAPEGAATILFRDAERAQELTERLKITAPELHALGLVDAIVPEPAPSAAADPDEASRLLAQAVGAALADLGRRPTRKLLQERWDRYQAIGRKHAGELRRLPFGRPRAKHRPEQARRLETERVGS
ncbi:MAG: acetyl-CoA carboxylase carboxyl transferase subunit beta [Thermomicrobiales bacterium]|nr:acetyl-CoA carboxylase carboxyl transferase subunit beta [Thermomicrobiales bacterium]